MGNYGETAAVDKQIASKMYSTAKLNRLRNYEQRKIERQRNLMILKRSTLPVLEDFIRRHDLKCNNCNANKDSYGITFEWQLEPVDILKVNTSKGFYGFNQYDATRRMLAKIIKNLVISPASITILKYLQAEKSEVPIIYVLNSKDYELDKTILNFILNSFDIKVPVSMTAMNENMVREKLIARENLILMIDDVSQLKMLLKGTECEQFKQVYMVPVSIRSEIKNSTMYNPSVFNFSQPNYGIVKVSLHEPYTFHDLLQRVDKEDLNAKHDAIYGHLVHDIAFKCSVMSTDIVGYLLLTQFREGGTLEDIATSIDKIRNTNLNIDFAFQGDSLDVAIYALKLIDKNVSIDENLVIRPLQNSPTLLALWEYGETLICNLSLQSALLLSVENLKRADEFVDFYKMIDLAVELCEILQFEIPFYKPCSDIKQQLEAAFDVLSIQELLTKPIMNYTENEMRARKMAQNFEDLVDDYNEDNYYDDYDDTEDYMDPNNRVTLNVDKQNEIDELKSILLPMLETYKNVAICIKWMIGHKMMEKSELLRISMDAMKGMLKYDEKIRSY